MATLTRNIELPNGLDVRYLTLTSDEALLLVEQLKEVLSNERWNPASLEVIQENDDEDKPDIGIKLFISVERPKQQQT